MFKMEVKIMNNFMNLFENKLLPLSQKIGENRYMNAIKDGFIASMPLIIVGALFLLLANLPIQSYLDLMENLLGKNWQNNFTKVNDATMSIITIFVIIGSSSSLGKYYQLNNISCISIAIGSYMILTPITDGNLALSDLGSTGLFLGLISSIFSVEIIKFVKKKNWVIHMPETVPTNISASFSSLIPAAITFIIFNFIRILFELTPFGTASQFVYQILQYPLMNIGSTLPAILITVFMEMSLWSLGIHGSSIVGSVTDPIMTALTAENAAATAAGLIPTHIINQQFLANFVRLGGAGATIGLAICTLLFAKSKQYKTLGKLGLAPIVFQINEPFIFGIPIVLNPIMIIPFILCPLVIAIICFTAFYLGLVPIISGVAIPWTTPPFISGFLLCGFKGFLLQLFCTLISVAIYYPFFKILDKQAYQQEHIQQSKGGKNND